MPSTSIAISIFLASSFPGSSSNAIASASTAFPSTSPACMSSSGGMRGTVSRSARASQFHAVVTSPASAAACKCSTASPRSFLRFSDVALLSGPFLTSRSMPLPRRNRASGEEKKRSE
ncbi:hypothetical protein M427DRAFT_62524 [Gonapodya prolifera JEL478]|uniref:Uncharacterized protein n=1 Tax=Gonapodya prolifera (strain JEL478) TaxID=1344416 RepID=A0A139A0N3_GONPJ|nr:hypothetical protein M427DRAFT_62524 [Gonapodya prolifera JEL478]|eukprot:KXS10329.1 hypothetical protein M427DRAFT_62524 [Gonapodya prolifera JEL478]